MEVSAIMKKYEDLVAQNKAEVVGQSVATLPKGNPSHTAGICDFALNILADGMKAAMNTDFALMNRSNKRVFRRSK